MKHPVYIMGDFNIDLINSNSKTVDYLGISIQNMFIQLIESPTRVSSISSTLIDHVFHNNVEEVQATVHKISITDHYATSIRVPFSKDTKRSENVLKREMKFLIDENARMSYLTELHSSLETIYSQQNLETGFTEFINSLNNTVTKHTSYKYQRKVRKPAWWTKRIKNAISKKNKVFRIYQCCPTRANFLHYKQCRNNVCSMLHSAKKDYFSQNFNSKFDHG